MKKKKKKKKDEKKVNVVFRKNNRNRCQEMPDDGEERVLVKGRPNE